MTKPKLAKRISESPVLASLATKVQELGLDTTPDTTWERIETPAEQAARLEVVRRNLAARWAARLPIMYADATMDDLVADDLPRDLGTWLVKDASPTLVLAGAVGTGKTHAAYAIGNTAVARGIWTEAWTVTDLLEAMRPAGDPTVAADVRRCQLLVLDDLGAGKATEWAVEQITALVDARLRDGLRQIVTTNHPYEALEAAWGGRVMDRLRYRWTVVTFAGESRRRAAW